MIRVLLPAHLKTLAGVSREVTLEVDGVVCAGAIIDAIETAYPTLRGTIRDPATGRRRPFVRFFVDGEDVSHEPLDQPLASTLASGGTPFIVVGAMAGG
ncbi:MAG: MoaD/ThiS family protein [Acidimicrobiales bacterium]